MQVTIGKNSATGQVVALDTARVINGHLQIAGITGMGKTHRIIALVKAMVESASVLRQPMRVHVFDPHGDIDLPYASEVKFSEATQYGYNPLEINADPHDSTLEPYFNGMKVIEFMGVRMIAVLFALLSIQQIREAGFLFSEIFC